MSRTAFIQEIQEDGRPALRVSLTLDLAETMALADMAAFALDASVLIPDLAEENVAANAENMLRWAERASTALATMLAKKDVDAIIAWQPISDQVVLRGDGVYLVKQIDLWRKRGLGRASRRHDPFGTAGAEAQQDLAVRLGISW